MKRLFLLVALAVVLASVLGLYYWCTSSGASSIEGPVSGYLTYKSSSEETLIFLVSTANPQYGTYNWSNCEWDDGEVHEGDSCFIVTVTVRNDYTTDPLWTDEDSPSGMYNNYVKLTAYLYNQQNRVDAVDVTYPINSLHGGHVFRIEPEDTHSVDLYLATDCKNIDRYEICVSYIGPAMEP